MKLNNRTISAPRVEMLPLIDIVFLLLVFFIYAMLSMAVHRGQEVDLPQSGTAGLETNEALGITIQDADNGLKIFVNEEPVALVELEQLLIQEKAVSKKDNPVVQIFADESVSYQGLFQVLDKVKQAGLSSISLQAEAESTTP